MRLFIMIGVLLLLATCGHERFNEYTPLGPSYQGEPGNNGDPGEAGLNGQDGKDGASGQNGLAGSQGPRGNPGHDGEDGRDGTNGCLAACDGPKHVIFSCPDGDIRLRTSKCEEL